MAGINPALSIVAALGLGFVVVAFTSLATGVVLFTVLTFFELICLRRGFHQARRASVGPRLASQAEHDQGREGGLPDQHAGIFAVLLAFLAWATLSYAWSEQPSEALTAVSRLALNAVLFLIVYTASAPQEM